MPLVIRSVRLIDGVAEVAREAVDVTVDGPIHRRDRAPTGGPPPDGAIVIDGAGRTLLPGPIDCHAHYPIDTTVDDGFAQFRQDPEAAIALRSAGAARRASRRGDHRSQRRLTRVVRLRPARRDIAAGHVPVPAARGRPCPHITGGHGWPFGREADSVLEFVRGVRANVRDGADVIKAVASEAAMLSGWDQGAGRRDDGGRAPGDGRRGGPAPSPGPRTTRRAARRSSARHGPGSQASSTRSSPRRATSRSWLRAARRSCPR